jgi:hypothetical protein
MGAVIQQGHRSAGRRSVITLGMVFIVTNTNRAVLDWCASAVGAGLVVQKRRHTEPGRLPCFCYRLDAQQAIAELLPQLLPYLKIKTPHATAASAYLKSRMGRLNRAAFNTEEINLFFEVRLASLANQRHASGEVITYRKQEYNRDAFERLILENRIGSSYRVVEWTPEMEALVGTDIDRKVAEHLGLKLAQVQRRREQLGRPPFGSIPHATKATALQLRAQGQTIRAIADSLNLSYSAIQRLLTTRRPELR